MSIFSVIFFRLLAFLKWVFQSSGIVLSFFILSSNRDVEFIALVSMTMVILPELIMGAFLWMLQGVCWDNKREDSKKVAVFGPGTLLFSRFHYIGSLSSLGLSAGLFLGVPILLGGTTLVSCFFLLDKMKALTSRYFQIYC